MLKHAFVPSQSDGADATKLQPSHWKAEHVFDGGSNGQILSRDSGQASGVSWINAPSIALLQAGESYISLRPAGLVYSDATILGTGADTAATTLWTYDLPPNTLARTGDAIEIRALVRLANTATTKTVVLNIGASASKLVATTTGLTLGSNEGMVMIVARVVRRSENTHDVTAVLMSGLSASSGAMTWRGGIRNAISDDLTGFLTLAIIGTNGTANANDIEYRSAQITYLPAPPSVSLAAPTWLMLLGDSKTAFGGWPYQLDVRGAAHLGTQVFHKNAGIGGATVASYATAIAATLAAMPSGAGAAGIQVLCNLGVNDLGSLPAEATWEANYLTIIDAVHVKWPTATVRLMIPWSSGRDTEAGTVATRIGHLVAARPAFVVTGPDERTWLKGGDAGATNTTDGTHYTEAGKTAASIAWYANIWP